MGSWLGGRPRVGVGVVPWPGRPSLVPAWCRLGVRVASCVAPLPFPPRARRASPLPRPGGGLSCLFAGLVFPCVCGGGGVPLVVLAPGFSLRVCGSGACCGGGFLALSSPLWWAALPCALRLLVVPFVGSAPSPLPLGFLRRGSRSRLSLPRPAVPLWVFAGSGLGLGALLFLSSCALWVRFRWLGCVGAPVPSFLWGCSRLLVVALGWGVRPPAAFCPSLGGLGRRRGWGCGVGAGCRRWGGAACFGSPARPARVVGGGLGAGFGRAGLAGSRSGGPLGLGWGVPSFVGVCVGWGCPAFALSLVLFCVAFWLSVVVLWAGVVVCGGGFFGGGTSTGGG